MLLMLRLTTNQRTYLVAGLALGDSDVREDLLEELPSEWAWPLADDDVSAGERSNDVAVDANRCVLLTSLLQQQQKP